MGHRDDNGLQAEVVVRRGKVEGSRARRLASSRKQGDARRSRQRVTSLLDVALTQSARLDLAVKSCDVKRAPEQCGIENRFSCMGERTPKSAGKAMSSPMASRSVLPT